MSVEYDNSNLLKQSYVHAVSIIVNTNPVIEIPLHAFSTAARPTGMRMERDAEAQEHSDARAYLSLILFSKFCMPVAQRHLHYVWGFV